MIGAGGLLFAERMGWISRELEWALPLLLVSLGVGLVVNEVVGWVRGRGD